MDKKGQLIEYITQDLVAYVAEEFGLSVKEAMNRVYLSKLYEKLLDTETGLYLEGSGYVYGILKDELKYGRLVQMEI